jgi:tetratricopeptide (TPR) repeat protein
MSRRTRELRRFLAASSLFAACALPLVGALEHGARAADASLADKAAAQSLFDEGRKLMTEGNFAQACPKLAESQKLDPGVGTLFHLADCYERLGQTASAWAGFLEAASTAKSLGQGDREKVAKDRAAGLASRLSKLTISSPLSEALPGLEIKRDGAVVGRALWGTAIPVDPGPHTVDATAPGKKPWHASTTVGADQMSAVVTIPALEDAPPGVTAPPASGAGEASPIRASSSGASRRTLGYVVGGAGVVGLGVGGLFALRAKSKYNSSLDHCSAPTLCNSEGLELRNDARSAGDLATLAVGIGSAALVAGVVLVLTAPSTDGPRVSLIPTAAPGAAGLTVVGAY